MRSWPSDNEARQALENSSATRRDWDGSWSWNPNEKWPVWYSDEDSIGIAKACLYLETLVTSVVSAQAWYALIQKVAALEAAVAVLYTEEPVSDLPDMGEPGY